MDLESFPTDSSYCSLTASMSFEHCMSQINTIGSQLASQVICWNESVKRGRSESMYSTVQGVEAPKSDKQ